ncbi:hypothetical protein SLA2020_221760 [Shorea laevis]
MSSQAAGNRLSVVTSITVYQMSMKAVGCYGLRNSCSALHSSPLHHFFLRFPYIKLKEDDTLFASFAKSRWLV